MTLRRAFIAAAMAVLLSPQASAAPLRLDDSLTHTVPPNVQMQWRALGTGLEPMAAVEAWVRVNVRIDTRPIANRSGRVYMVLEADETFPIEAVWTSQGRLQNGRLVSGERALVFSGAAGGATLEDQLLMRLRSGPDWEKSSRRLQFHFEFEAD